MVFWFTTSNLKTVKWNKCNIVFLYLTYDSSKLEGYISVYGS